MFINEKRSKMKYYWFFFNGELLTYTSDLLYSKTKEGKKKLVHMRGGFDHLYHIKSTLVLLLKTSTFSVMKVQNR